jgi:hypothetical protein
MHAFQVFRSTVIPYVLPSSANGMLLKVGVSSHLTQESLTPSLLPDIKECSVFNIFFTCLRLRTSHFPKDLWILLMDNGI